MEDLVAKVVKTVSEGMKESGKMFLELEEKRMKFEEQQRREGRQFQLQMMQMLLGSSHQSSQPTDPHAQYFPTYPPYPRQPSQYHPGSGETDDS